MAEVNSRNGSDVGACAFDDSSTSVLPELDSADIIPEAAMKCGILPLDGDAMADLSINMPTENLCLYLHCFTVLQMHCKHKPLRVQTSSKACHNSRHYVTGVGAQSTLGGHDIFARKICMRIHKMPEFYMIFARKCLNFI